MVKKRVFTILLLLFIRWDVIFSQTININYEQYGTITLSDLWNIEIELPDNMLNQYYFISIELFDNNNNQLTSVIVGDNDKYQLIDKYLITNIENKSAKNIDKESKNGYDNISVLSIFSLSILWKLFSKILIKV